MSLHKIKFTSAPSPKLTVWDVKVCKGGREPYSGYAVYSQLASGGAFSSEILSRLPPLHFTPEDAVGKTVSVGFLLNGHTFERNVDIELVSKADEPRSFIFPSFTCTQLAGRLVEVVTTPRLWDAIKKKQVEITLKESPMIGKGAFGEVTAVKDPFDALRMDEGRLILKKPMIFDVSSKFEVDCKPLQPFDGPEFGRIDLVGIIEVDRPKDELERSRS